MYSVVVSTRFAKWLSLGWICAGLTAFFVQVWRFRFVTDDAYISFVYARNLAEKGELVYSAGSYVEGYTNFLWTVLLAGTHWLGIPMEYSSQVMGVLFALGTMGIWFKLCQSILTPPDNGEWLPGFVVFLLAISASFQCWATGGLETQLFVFCVSAALYWARQESFLKAGIACGLAMMSRPEGALLAGVLGLGLLISKVERRNLFRFSAGALILVIPWVGWKWWYYGALLPNTYYVKAAGVTTPEYRAAVWDNGFFYLWQWAKQSSVLWMAPFVALTFLLKNRKWTISTLVFALLYLGYTARVGGDFMGLHRFVLPVSVIAMGLAVLGLTSLRKWLGSSGLLVVCVLGGTAFGWQQSKLASQSRKWGNWSQRGIDTPAYLQIYAEDRGAVGKALKPCMKGSDFAIVGGAGAQTYFGDFAGVDVFGLVSDRIAHGVNPTRPRAGHGKWGTPAILSSYNPNFLFHCYRIHKDEKLSGSLCGEERFWTTRGFQRATLHVPGMREMGEYYTFLVHQERRFSCPGLLP